MSEQKAVTDNFCIGYFEAFLSNCMLKYMYTIEYTSCKLYMMRKIQRENQCHIKSAKTWKKVNPSVIHHSCFLILIRYLVSVSPFKSKQVLTIIHQIKT